jgi:hypothetical protein
MPFTGPPTAITGSVVTIAYTNTFAANDAWFHGLLPAPTGIGQVPISSSTSAAAWGYVTGAQIADGAITGSVIGAGQVTSAKVAADAVTFAKLAPSVIGGTAVVGMSAWVRTAAEIPVGWPRETTLDGRVPVGAGTEYGVTYVENTPYGSSWYHSHPISDATGTPDSLTTNLKGAGGGWPVSHPSHTHTLTGSSGNDAWSIPMRVVVFVRKS